jgi:carboxymethylenebutenolidase
MTEDHVLLSTPDGPMEGFLALPDTAEKAPAVVVAQEAFGVNAHIEDVCRRFASAGYGALAPELYHRSGRGLVIEYDDFAKVRPLLAKLTNDELATDTRAALGYLRAHPSVDSGRVGIVGFCLGGFAAFLAACRTNVAAAVCFYGGGIAQTRPGIGLSPLLDETPHIHAPILCFFGAEDQSISAEDVDAVRSRLETLETPHEVVVYEGVGHAFFCDQRSSYHAASATDAWQKTMDFFGRRLA